ncbi:unnamed protein product [Closterium sp. Yama58-4]|nr:unnamed protein product [Closterium sp. Yama58-4]
MRVFAVLIMFASLPALIQGCSFSSVKGYTSVVSPVKGVSLHWKVVDKDTVNFLLKGNKHRSKGWYAVGFSDDGEMTGDAFAVTSESSTPKVLALTGASTSGVADASWSPDVLTLKKKSGGPSSLKFQRKVGDGGSVSIKPKGKNTLMFVVKSDKFDTGVEHDEDVIVKVNLGCNPCKGPLSFMFCKAYYRRLSARPQSSPANRLSLFCLALPLLVLLAHPPCAHSARSPEATHTALPGATQSAPPARSASAVPPQLRNLLGAFRRCQPSSLPGFTTSKSFYGGLTLHWAATTGSTLRLALQAKAGSVSAKSWFAIGWTPDGQMSGSDAVVRVPSSNTPGRFFLDGYSNVHATTSFAIGSPSIETTSSHGTVMKFSRSSGDGGEVAVKPRGRSQMVWAYGADAWSTTAQHDARGTTSIDFSCNGCWVLFFKVC